MACGADDVVVAVMASPQSTVIGGATQPVRDLVAVWEQRDVMAREVAVDVASGEVRGGLALTEPDAVRAKVPRASWPPACVAEERLLPPEVV